jgi:hypothetical protein
MTSFVDDEGRTTRPRLPAPLLLREFRLLWTSMRAVPARRRRPARRAASGVRPVPPAAMSPVGVALTLPQVALLLSLTIGF